jgi:hypothetical protein
VGGACGAHAIDKNVYRMEYLERKEAAWKTQVKLGG